MSDIRIAALRERIIELERELDATKRHAICAFCGYIFVRDDQTANRMAEHMLECEKHPMNKCIQHFTEALSLIDGVTELVEVYRPKSPAQADWKQDWLRRANVLLKGGDNAGNDQQAL